LPDGDEIFEKNELKKEKRKQLFLLDFLFALDGLCLYDLDFPFSDFLDQIQHLLLSF
jgi:hypothetical protein